jgi:hypothetical protein
VGIYDQIICFSFITFHPFSISIFSSAFYFTLDRSGIQDFFTIGTYYKRPLAPVHLSPLAIEKMVFPKKILLFALVALISTGETIPGPQDAGRAVINVARSLWMRGMVPRPQYVQPATLPDPISLPKGAKQETLHRHLAPDKNFRSCQTRTLGWGDKKNRIKHHEMCSYSLPSGNHTIDTATVIQRLNKQHDYNVKAGSKFNVRSIIEPGKFEYVQGWPEETIEWSNNPGKMIQKKEACQLCTSIDESYIVPRAYLSGKDGSLQCSCKKWAQQYEKFEVCNCNVCDALLIQMGLRDKCMDMVAKNIKLGYLSRYVALDGHNAFVRVYTDKSNVGKAVDHALGDIQKEKSVCRSGVQGKWVEDKEGVLFKDVKLPNAQCPKELDEAANMLG